MTTQPSESEPVNPLITLQQIYDQGPCFDSWAKGLRLLGCKGMDGVVGVADTVGLFDPSLKVSLGDIAHANGAADAMWCVRCLDWRDIAVRRCVVSAVLLPAAERAMAHVDDPRVVDYLAVIQRWRGGDDSVDLRAAAYAVAGADSSAIAVYVAFAADSSASSAADAFVVATTNRAQQVRDIIAAFPRQAALRCYDKVETDH